MTVLEARELADDILRRIDFAIRTTPDLLWAELLVPFLEEGARIAERLRQVAGAFEILDGRPGGTVVASPGKAARCVVGAGLELVALEEGAAGNLLTAEWATSDYPPLSQAFIPEGGATPTVGYVTIEGNPSADFDGVIEITGTGAVGVGTYRLSTNGGADFGSSTTIPSTPLLLLGLTLTFAAEVGVPSSLSPPTPPATANYVTGASFSWSSRGSDKLTIKQAGIIREAFEPIPYGTALWFVEGQDPSDYLGAASWLGERPAKGSYSFSGGVDPVTMELPTEEIVTGPLDQAIAEGGTWITTWEGYAPDVVTRSPSAPRGL